MPFVGQKIGGGVCEHNKRGRPSKGSRMIRTSIRVREDKWKAFDKMCKDQGSSACFELRSYIDARLGGESVATARYPLIINLSQNYLMNNKRPRRIGNYPLSELDVDRVKHFGSREKCTFCKEKPIYLGFIWVSKHECNVCFLCDVHHADSKARYGVKYGYRRC